MGPVAISHFVEIEDKTVGLVLPRLLVVNPFFTSQVGNNSKLEQVYIFKSQKQSEQDIAHDFWPEHTLSERTL